MPESAGFQIRADLKAMRKELAQARSEFRDFNQDVLRSASTLKPLEENAEKAGKGVKNLSFGAQALSTTLGFLGAQSIQQVLFKLKDFITDSLRLGIALDGVEARAKAMFGSTLPSVTKEIQRISVETKRSESSLLGMATSFGSLLDSVGASQKQVASFSTELSKLAVVLGKAFPDRSDQEIAGAIERSILGATKGLREYGIVMTNKVLQDLADRKGIKLKIQEMTEEQKVMLRTQFLLEETTKLQQAAAASTGSIGDTAKTTKERWQDLKEEVGQGLGPAFASGMQFAIGLAEAFIGTLGEAARMIRAIGLDLSSRGGVNQADIDALSASYDLNLKNQAALNAAMERRRLTGSGVLQAGVEEDFWRKQSPSGGGGGQNPQEKRQQATEKLIQALREQAKANEDNVRTLKDDLELRQKLGIITSDESQTLDSINRRLTFQKEKVDDATRAWEEQRRALEEVENQIESLNERIVDERERLQDTLAGIDKDAKRAKSDTLVDLVQELKDIDKQLSVGEGNHVELLNRKRELDRLVDPFRLTEEGRAQLGEADKVAGFNEFERIDYDSQQRKADATAESDARIAGLEAELRQAEENKSQIVALEQEKKQAVIEAIQERVDKTATAYMQIEESTRQHVKAMTELYGQLAAAARTPSVPAAPIRRAGGGPVYGEGGPTDDNIHTLLSNGEYVINAMATKKYRPLIEAINGMRLPIPRFAAGGLVSQQTTHADNRVYNIKQAFNRSEFSNPLLHRWHMRSALP